MHLGLLCGWGLLQHSLLGNLPNVCTDGFGRNLRERSRRNRPSWAVCHARSLDLRAKRRLQRRGWMYVVGRRNAVRAQEVSDDNYSSIREHLQRRGYLWGGEPGELWLVHLREWRLPDHV